MANTTITVRTDTELKAETQKVLAKLGMDMCTATREKLYSQFLGVIS